MIFVVSKVYCVCFYSFCTCGNSRFVDFSNGFKPPTREIPRIFSPKKTIGKPPPWPGPQPQNCGQKLVGWIFHVVLVTRGKRHIFDASLKDAEIFSLWILGPKVGNLPQKWKGSSEALFEDNLGGRCFPWRCIFPGFEFVLLQLKMVANFTGWRPRCGFFPNQVPRARVLESDWAGFKRRRQRFAGTKRCLGMMSR